MMQYYLGFCVSQIDTHVKGTLTECAVRQGKKISERVLLDYTVFPKEVFLYWRINRVFIAPTISKHDDFSHFEDYYKTLVKPSKLKLSGEYISKIDKIRSVYEIIVAVIAVDDEYSKIDISTTGAWNYSFGQIVVRKSLLETIVKALNPRVIFPNIWTDIEYRLKKLKPMIQYSDLMKPYKNSLINAIDIILDSPVNVLFSNSLKMVAPTVESVVKDYISIKNIKGIKTNNLSTIVGGIANYQGPEFSNEIKEYLKLILEPIRNLLLHGGVPSEPVCNFLIVIVLEIYEELINKS